MDSEAACVVVARAAARDVYGRLVALLSARTGDIAAAEDALSESFAAALSSWPRDGVPDEPEAWLLTVARRRVVDGVRRRAVGQRHAREVARLADERCTREPLPEKRLRLMYACAHPAIDASVRAPLMLQAVLGLTADQIGAAFLVSPSAMGQRLARSKRKIRDAGVPLDVSPEAMVPDRLAVVCEAIYAAFTTGYNDVGTGVGTGLSEEAIWLARMVCEQSLGNAEVYGLLALLLFVHSRRSARRAFDGAFIPLESQDTASWDIPMIAEADALLRAASAAGRVGRFQLEAAIQSAHAARHRAGSSDWAAIESLYTALRHIAPTLGAAVAHAAAVEKTRGAGAALAMLDGLAAEHPVDHFQPYWAVRAHLEAELGIGAEASVERAAALTEDEGVRAYLRGLLTT